MNENQCRANGGQWKDNRCIVKKKKEINKRELNLNPMNYIGGIIGAVVILVFMLMIKCNHIFGTELMPTSTTCKIDPVITWSHINGLLSHPSGILILMLFILIIAIIIGFLIGLFIQRLIKK